MNYFQFKLKIPHIAFKLLVVETSSFFYFLAWFWCFFGGVHKIVSRLVVVLGFYELKKT